MRLAIRADASDQIGSGHVVRCLALGEAWCAAGGDALFLSRVQSESLRSRILDRGMRFVPQSATTGDELDLLETLQQLSKQRDSRNTHVVLDGYQFGTAYQQAIRDVGYPLLVIDDVAHLPWYHATWLLNHGAHSGGLTYQRDSDTQLLLGAQYALVRPEFSRQRGQLPEVPPVARRILVTMGGGDVTVAVETAIRALDQVRTGSLEAVVLTMSEKEDRVDRIQHAANACRWPVRIVRDAPDIPSHMAWADLAISAAGGTCWELATMGVPALLVVVADNQRVGAVGLQEHGLAINLGTLDGLTIDSIARAIENLAFDAARRASMCRAGRTLIDGQGPARVVNALRAGWAQ